VSLAHISKLGDVKPLLGEVAGQKRDWALEICVFLAGPLSSFFLFPPFLWGYKQWLAF